MKFKQMTAEEAASMINHGEIVGVSGFTPAGDPKEIPFALAQRAEKLHEEGKEFKISLFTGASTGDRLDGALARAKAINKRMPYQSNPSMRNAINAGELEFMDQHLSHMPQNTRYGFYGKVTTAIVEAVELTDDGKLYLSTAGGAIATYLQQADKIFVEINKTLPKGLKEMHDVYMPTNPPHREPIPIVKVNDKVGTPYVQINPDKVAGVVYTETPNGAPLLREPGADEKAIAEHVMEFLSHETKMGRLPKGLPYQSGVGNVANAVLACFATYPGLEPIKLYTEVIQDSIFQLADADRLDCASTCSLTLSADGIAKLDENIDYFKEKIVIRQQEISNNPEVIRRLGVIAMNTAIEVDVFGNVNSTNIMGSKMMNGIGGSGDFCRNGFLSFFMTPSIAKNGDISAIVPKPYGSFRALCSSNGYGSRIG
jgi:acyl-CoA hydrolase